MIIVTINYLPDKEFEVLGVAKGTVIQARHVGKDIMTGLKTMVGGELTSYTEMMNEARAKATQRMVKNAEEMGADAIINMRYASSAVMQGAAEILAYGTAVKIKE